ncbi:hypothetical protein Pfo_029229 [Paulownia fortunei]|nr:hypothetical protein Pfo_029229 [Paulownia fortunei]
MDVVKQRLQLKGSPYKRVLMEEGFGALYASYRTTVVMNAHFSAVQFATYEAAKSLLMEGVCGCGRFSSSSSGDVIQTIVKKYGCIWLIRGWIPRMLFHAPAAAICWST